MRRHWIPSRKLQPHRLEPAPPFLRPHLIRIPQKPLPIMRHHQSPLLPVHSDRRIVRRHFIIIFPIGSETYHGRFEHVSGWGEGGREFGVSDRDAAVETKGGAEGPFCGGAGGGGFEEGEDGGEGWVVVAFFVSISEGERNNGKVCREERKLAYL